MADQLSLYNGALRLCRETRLANLSEAREARYLLDDAWSGGATAYMLEQGYWYFAMRASQLGPDPAIVPAFGYANGYTKPPDWVRTAGMCSDPYFNVPITAVIDEAGRWFCDTNPLYIRYVSNDPSYGDNMDMWPETFCRAYEGYLALQVVRNVTTSDAVITDVEKRAAKLMTDARSKAAMNESSVFLPSGAWARARWGRNYLSDDGNQNQLIG